VIFGTWRLGRTLVGCVLFGLADAVRPALPARGITANSQLLIVAPHMPALLAMLLFSAEHREPRALGQPFQRRPR
jgi:ABC-type uncharacterized transport system permease subunit